MPRVLILANEKFVFQSVNPLDLAEVCADAGLEVTVAAAFTSESFEWNQGRGFDLIALTKSHRPLRNHEFWLRSIAVAKRLRPGVIIGVNPVGYVAADLALFTGLTRHTVYYALELSLPQDFPRSPAVRWQMVRARRASLVLTTGEERATELQIACNLSQRPFVIANSPIRGPQGRSHELRKRLAQQGPIGRYVLLYTGSMGAPNSLVEAAAASTLWSADCTIVIQAFGGSDVQRAEISASVERTRGRARLFPSVPGGRQALLNWISGSDLGLVLYDHERDPSMNMLYYTPNKLFDYMSCGLPVVASDNPSLLREVRSRGWGVCCRPSRPESIASAVDEAVGQYSRLAERARALFENEYRYPVQARAAVERIALLAGS